MLNKKIKMAIPVYKFETNHKKVGTVVCGWPET